MSGTLLSVRDVSKNFGDVEALKSVTLDLNRGDIVGLVGGNGAGKTTAIGIITSLVNKTSGDVVVFDHDIDNQLSLAKS